MDRELFCDASEFEPVMESELNLASAKLASIAGAEEWTSVGSIRSIDVLPEQPAESRVEEHGLFASTFGPDEDGPLS